MNVMAGPVMLNVVRLVSVTVSAPWELIWYGTLDPINPNPPEPDAFPLQPFLLTQAVRVTVVEPLPFPLNTQFCLDGPKVIWVGSAQAGIELNTSTTASTVRTATDVILVLICASSFSG